MRRNFKSILSPIRIVGKSKNIVKRKNKIIEMKGGQSQSGSIKSLPLRQITQMQTLKQTSKNRFSVTIRLQNQLSDVLTIRIDISRQDA